MRSYLQILRTPRVGVLLVATSVARLPLAMNGLAIILFVRQETGSFALAGAAAGAFSLGLAAGTPTLSRIIDRLGPRTLLPGALAHATALGLLVLGGEAGLPGGVLIALALLVGATFPPSAVFLRASWPALMDRDPELVPTAYALDSVLVQAIFVTGPLVTAGVAALGDPALALLVAAGAVLAGTVGFLAALPPRTEPEHADQDLREDPLGALRAPGIRTVILATLPIGIAIGTLQVGIPAFAADEGSADLSGVLLATWSATSVIGGLVYGTLARSQGLTGVHLRITLLIPIGFLAPVAATSPLVMALLLIPAGALITPFIATRNELAQRVAPEGNVTEALAWPITALTAGIAIGAALAGVLAEGPGWRAAIALGPLAATGAAIAVAARRRTLDPPAAYGGASTNR